jgi:hypothetical protein
MRQNTAKDIGHAELYPFPNTVPALNVFCQNEKLPTDSLEPDVKKSELHVFPMQPYSSRRQNAIKPPIACVCFSTGAPAGPGLGLRPRNGRAE